MWFCAKIILLCYAKLIKICAKNLSKLICSRRDHTRARMLVVFLPSESYLRSGFFYRVSESMKKVGQVQLRSLKKVSFFYRTGHCNLLPAYAKAYKYEVARDLQKVMWPLRDWGYKSITPQPALKMECMTFDWSIFHVFILIYSGRVHVKNRSKETVV